jgi:hypothetical protein
MMLYWTIWLVVVVIGGFGVGETYALMTNRMTFSRYVWSISKAFPLFPFIVGAVIGGLAVHFWWGGAVCFEPA